MRRPRPGALPRDVTRYDAESKLSGASGGERLQLQEPRRRLALASASPHLTGYPQGSVALLVILEPNQCSAKSEESPTLTEEGCQNFPSEKKQNIPLVIPTLALFLGELAL